MPGHLMRAACACGFERELGPGASVVSGLYVIAYSADQRDLVTIELKEAKKKNLTVIEDPKLKEEAEAENKIASLWANGPWGPYHCPSCGHANLQLWHVGFWD